ncbi:MAG: DUF2993 domain-containing protein [Armatimonadetes bacterium]|jgi:hypothetical protein|nr:DUF2993 domain-containing protein [Armatimonadota bacterium]
MPDISLVRRGSSVALALLLLFGAVAGCNTGVVERSAEKRLRDRLPQIIGPAASYRVDIRAGSDLSVVQGRLREVRIEGEQVRVGGQWPVDQLLVLLERVRINLEQETLEEVGSARFQATIRPATLIDYLEEDQESLRDVRIHLERGRLVITGRYLLVRVWTPFRVAGTLELLGKEQLGFKPLRASAAGIPVPERVVRYLEEQLNPVLDVSRALLPMELTSVVIRPDGVIVTGIPHLDDPSLLIAE